MFKNNPFEAATKAMMANAEKFMAPGSGDSTAQLMANLKDWGELMQAQAQAAQEAAQEAMAALKDIKNPQDAMEALKNSAQTTLALTAKHMQEATALSVAQFTAGVDAMQSAHPLGQALAPMAKGMKTAASAVETAVSKGTSAVKTAAKKTAAPAAKKTGRR